MTPTVRILCFWLLQVAVVLSLVVNQELMHALFAGVLAALIRGMKPKIPGVMETLPPRAKKRALIIVLGLLGIDLLIRTLGSPPVWAEYVVFFLLAGWAVWLDVQLCKNFKSMPPHATGIPTTA